MPGRNFWLFVVGAHLVAAPIGRCYCAAAEDPTPAAEQHASESLEPSAAALSDWVAQLNDDDYAVREAATERLIKSGTASIEALVAGAGGEQAEAAWRCAAALEQIGLEGDDRAIELIVKHLDAAQAKAGRQGLKSLARDLHARQKQFRRDRAVAQIRKHGGQIAGSVIDGDIVDGMAMPVPMLGPAIIFDGPVMEVEAIALAEPAAVEAVRELPGAEALDLFEELTKLLIPGAKEKMEVPADEAGELGGGFPGGGFPGGFGFGGFGLGGFPGGFGPDADAEPADRADRKDREPVADEPIPEKPVVAEPAEDKPAEAPVAPALEESEPIPADAIEAVEPAAEALGEVRPVVMADVGFAVDMGGGPAGSGSWAALALDQRWSGGDDALAILQDLPELAQIELNHTKLTDKALIHLAKLPRLRQLQLNQPGFSTAALLKFHRQRPNVVIYARGDAMMGVNADFGSSPVMLTSIFEGSGADDAGLKIGDVIHQIDGIQMRDFSDLTICISAKKPGDKVDVQFERGGQKRSVQVVLKLRTLD